MLTPFLALVRKDLRLFFADPRAVLMSVVAPIVIASFFGYIFGGGAGNGDTSKIVVRIADLDGSALTQEIVNRLAADPALDVKPATPGEAREAVRKGKAAAAFVIPKDFGAGAAAAFLTGGRKPEIAMMFDPSRSIEMRMLQGILSGAVMETAGKRVFRGPVTLPFQVQTEAVTAGRGISYNGYAHAFGGMGIQFLLMVGVEVGVNLLLRRQQGVWKRMRAAPLSRGVLLGSRAASSGITSMGTLMILFGFARLVFGVRIQGSMLGFLCLCAAFSLMTAAFGLLIASVGKTPETTRGLAILTTLFMVMLGGAWVPTFIFPKWLQAATVVIPTRWAMDGLDAVTWRGLGFGAVAPQVGLLLGCALVFGTVAATRFRWEAD
ncbi:MAG TPA: ABC transporter permease [Candidatus Sulfopaludibacter sp.]|jgi:ABC-2 type transport system permease protein|nr:ABC transporter permease [Candidatus Sulfopaludibacter sp.]